MRGTDPDPVGRPSKVDHVVVSVRGLDEAISRWSRAGLAATPGGSHPTGTANALVRGPRDAYLELIDVVEESDHATAHAVRARPGPLTWAISVPDLETCRRRLLEFGLETGDPVGSSRVAPDGDTYVWETCEIAGHVLHPFVPFLIRWKSGMPRGPVDGPVISSLDLEVPDPLWLRELLVRCGLSPDESMAGIAAVTDGDLTVRLREGNAGVVAIDWAVAPPEPHVLLDGLVCNVRWQADPVGSMPHG
ncbi:VOC family protein [Nocardioides sp. LHD-245]|uniref:VOC family protein n=1 Tax=Nocardioides sp. LHD-245 TaxID=3051387 RepID=UPI0027E1E4D5|nr:VOC family protein [Nocardioides sp. LHD-245]